MLRFSLVLVLLSMTSPVQARDVSALQVGVEYARENLEKAEADYKDSLQRVSNSEKRLADAQKNLTDDRQKAALTQKSLEESRAKYEKAQQVLDQAWKQP